MKKYIAFGLYQKNEQGAFQPAGAPSLQQDVYLVSDVHALLTRIRDAVDTFTVQEEIDSVLMGG